MQFPPSPLQSRAKNHRRIVAVPLGNLRYSFPGKPSSEKPRQLHSCRNKHIHLLLSKRKCVIFLLETKMAGAMKQKTDVLQGTLALMVLKTLDVLGSLHGYGIARRIEQISGDLLAVNQGTLYPVLLKLEQEGAIASEWGASENNRRARFYRLTREGRKQLQLETQDWEQTAAIISRFFEAKAEDLS
jgi:PadR family transcriptional regulator